ncbi:MAG: TrkA C-terminal domain-containing protein [Acidobacteriota bacterium]
MDVRVVQPAMAVALALEGALHFPTAFGMLLDQRDDVDLLDIPLGNPEFVGRPLRSVRFAGNALVVGFPGQGVGVVPHGDTVLRRGDILVLVGSPDSLRQARAQLETSS